MEQVKVGYKKTEVGIIPEDWGLPQLEYVLVGIFDIDHYMPLTTKVGVPYIMTGDLKEKVSRINLESAKKIGFEDYKKLSRKVKTLKEDIIFARYATVGTITFVDVDIEFVVSYSCVTIKPKHSILNSKFLFYYLKSRSFEMEVINRVNSNIQANVGIGDLYKMHIPLPPSLTEQKAIATALSDVDELIAKLEKLIEKKKAIKQGAMQQLLTPPHKGGKRLEGFSGEWVEMRLGDLCKITTGKLDANAMIPNGEYRFYTCAKDYYYIDNYAFNTEALLVSGNGANVGYIHYYNGKFNAYQRTYVLDKFSENIQFIKLLLEVYLAKRITSEKFEGNTPYIVMETLTGMLFHLPCSRSEQDAIATILIEMEAEIRGLEKEKAKYLNIKQGMMQELLTGRTRLI
jgi:type I restriction enzyme S subunit